MVSEILYQITDNRMRFSEHIIQKFMKGDPTGRALAVSSFLGVLAAVPTPITGTAIGALALGFAGFRYFRQKQEAPGGA